MPMTVPIDLAALLQEANSTAQTIPVTCLAAQPGDLAYCQQYQTQKPEVGLRLSRALRMVTDI